MIIFFWKFVLGTKDLFYFCLKIFFCIRTEHTILSAILLFFPLRLPSITPSITFHFHTSSVSFMHKSKIFFTLTVRYSWLRRDSRHSQFKWNKITLCAYIVHIYMYNNLVRKLFHIRDINLKMLKFVWGLKIHIQ